MGCLFLLFQCIIIVMYILLIQCCALKQPHWSKSLPSANRCMLSILTHTKMYSCTFSSAHPLSSKAIDHIIAIKDDKPVRHANHEGSGSAGSCKALADVSFFRKKKEKKKKKQRKKKGEVKKQKKIIPLQPPPILPTPPHPRLLS